MNVIDFNTLEHDVTRNPCRLFGIMLKDEGTQGRQRGFWSIPSTSSGQALRHDRVPRPALEEAREEIESMLYAIGMTAGLASTHEPIATGFDPSEPRHASVVSPDAHAGFVQPFQQRWA